jgi:hypothetical protein
VQGVRHLAQGRLRSSIVYKEHGLEALSDRSRRPVRYANQLPGQLENLIASFKRDKPHWGARKIRELLLRRLAAGWLPFVDDYRISSSLQSLPSGCDWSK